MLQRCVRILSKDHVVVEIKARAPKTPEKHQKKTQNTRFIADSKVVDC